MSEYVGYVYETINLKNNKIYIGQKNKDSIDKNYFGSGKLILKAIKKYGKDNFVLEMLCWKKTAKELDEAERFFIKAYDSTNKNIGYNISLGGQTGFMKGCHHTQEAKERMSEGRKGMVFTEEHKRKIGESGKGKHPKTLTEEWKRRIGLAGIGNKSRTGMPSPTKGIPHTEEAKARMSKSHMGQPAWNKGIHLSDEHKRKLSESKKGIKLSEERKKKCSLAAKERWARWRRAKLEIVA